MAPRLYIYVLLALVACGAAPRGRAAYVVTAKDDTPAGRTALRAAIGGAASDDTSGDGFVVRLDDGARARVAALPEVGAITPLAPDAKRGHLSDGAPMIVHVDLFDDATAAERDEVAAWLGGHHGSIIDRGATWIEARLSYADAIAAASLPAVRWVEARAESPRR